MRKVSSKRSMASKCSHSSSDEEIVPETSKKDSRPPSSVATRRSGYHDAPQTTKSTPSPEGEGEAGVRGRPGSRREGTEVSSVDGGSDHRYRRSRSQGHTSLSEQMSEFQGHPKRGRRQSSSIDDFGVPVRRRDAASIDATRERHVGSEDSDRLTPGRADRKTAEMQTRTRGERTDTDGAGYEEIDLRGSEAGNPV